MQFSCLHPSSLLGSFFTLATRQQFIFGACRAHGQRKKGEVLKHTVTLKTSSHWYTQTSSHILPDREVKPEVSGVRA